MYYFMNTSKKIKNRDFTSMHILSSLPVQCNLQISCVSVHHCRHREYVQFPTVALSRSLEESVTVTVETALCIP